MRLFLAIVPDEEAIKSISKIQNKIKEVIVNRRIRFVPIDQFHITLEFFADSNPNKIIDLLKDVSFNEFEAILDKIELIPNEKLTRVISLSSLPNSFSNKLNELKYNVEKLLGVEKENKNRSFLPHLTIVRVKRKITIDEIKRTKEIKLDKIKFRINSFTLYESRLSSEGAVYSKIHDFPAIH